MTYNYQAYRNMRILVTGASGYIGSMLIKRLLKINKEYDLNISLFALVRDLEKAKKNIQSKNVQFFVGDITNWDFVKRLDGFDHIIHCAATTKSSDMVANPVETSDTIILGMKNIIEIARSQKIKSMVFLSSMEVYGSLDSGGVRVTEEQLGELDIFNVRSCYPLAKRMAENYCYSYFREYNVPIKIARLAQVFGSGVIEGESRVFAQFANAVRNNTDIILHTNGNSMGNYVDIEDAINAILLILTEGKDGEVYNVVNESNTMRIREMAQLVADRVAEGNIKVSYQISEGEKNVYAAETGLMLSSKKIEQLGWKPQVSLEGMYNNMIDWMDIKEKSKIK